MTVSDTDLSNALLVSTSDGTYPDSDEVLTTELEGAPLLRSLQLIRESKHGIETDIQALSQKSSFDVDEWITQARQLQEDIERSKNVAREIVKDYEEGQTLLTQVQDAEAKWELLESETLFNQAITRSLEDILQADKALNETESTLDTGRVHEIAENIEQLTSRIENLTNSNAKEINRGRLLRIHEAAVEGLTTAAASMVVFTKTNGEQQVTVNHGNHEMLDVSFGRLLDALTTLDAFKDLLRSTSKTFRRRICQPIISRSSEGVTCTIDETSNRLSVSFISKNKDARGVLDCLSLTFFFLNTKFPRRLGSAIGTTLIEDLVDILICDWLNPSISLDLSDLTESYDIQKKVDELAEQLSSYGWPGHKSLRSWIERLPQTWLEKRRTSSLDAVRRVLKAPRGPNREVQRIEREHVSTEDQVFQNDKLNGGIAGQAGEDNRELAAPTDVSQKEEDDLSGWGFDADGENDDGTAQSPTIANDDARDSIDLEGRTDNGADNTHPDGSKAPTGRADAPPLNGSTEHQEVTLTETYLITDIPDYLLDIISREVQDAEQVKESKYAALESISASADLLSLPTLILAMFRATAPPYYTSTLLNGNMHLYNDCMFMAEKLGDLAKTASLTELRQGCHVLQKFARSAYAREMDTQRTILGDLLDGAQGFVSCTRFPYSTECENAVNSTIDRLRAVHQDWKAILSHSALLQSIGSLLSTVIEKILKDIEDMEDISEAESQRLAAFCGRFSSLEDLFMSQRLESTEKAGAEVVPLTAVYVSNWLRFQYLTNVLESSLADIKYLWTEGELSLEFNVDEVIDLIEALFADSSHRRNAIAEIRRSRQ